jgi:hypothetical protein
MGRLTNGATLMASQQFRDWLLVAAATTARTVVLEADTTPNHALRMRLAKEVIVSPQIVLDRLVTAVATDPDVSAQPPTFNEAAEPVVQAKVDGLWNKLAELMYGDLQ